MIDWDKRIKSFLNGRNVNGILLIMFLSVIVFFTLKTCNSCNNNFSIDASRLEKRDVKIYGNK